MSTIIPVQTIRRAFRTVKSTDLGFQLKQSHRLTFDDSVGRRTLADEIVRQLMAYRSMNTDDLVILDNAIISYSTLTPYLKAAARRHNLRIRFRHGKQLHKRSKAMRGTGRNITVVTLV